MSDNRNYKGDNRPSFPYSEQQIRARAASTDGDVWTVRCLNGIAHKHDDRSPSAFYYPATGWYGCNVCDLKGRVIDRPAQDSNKSRRALTTNSRPVAKTSVKQSKRKFKIPHDADKIVYRYKRTDGRCIHEMLRFEWPTSEGIKKTFLPRHINERCEWQTGDGPITWQPYNADKVVTAKRIYVVEGEKCASALESFLGQDETVITSSHGTNAPLKTDWSCIKRSKADLVFIPDRDQVGEKYMQSVAQLLHLDELKVIRLGGDREDGFDVADWIEEGNRWGDMPDATAEPIEARTEETAITAKRLPPRHADIKQEPIKWIWDGMLPRKKLTLLVGTSGINKSTMALWVASQISRGAIKGSDCGVCRTLIYSSEDDPGDTITPRLVAMGADISRTHQLEGPGDVNLPFDFANREHVSYLHDLANQFDLLIIDPIADICGDKNQNSSSVVRSAIAEIVDPVCRAGCAVLGIHHERKDSKQDDHLPDRASGSNAWVGRPRVVWMMHKALIEDCSPEARQRDMGTDTDSFGVMVNVKSNISKLGIAWHLEMPVKKDVITVQVGERFTMAPAEAIGQYKKASKTSATERLAEHQLFIKLSAQERGLQAVDEILQDPHTKLPIKVKDLVALVGEHAGIGRDNASDAVRKRTDKHKIGREWWCEPK